MRIPPPPTTNNDVQLFKNFLPITTKLSSVLDTEISLNYTSSCRIISWRSYDNRARCKNCLFGYVHSWTIAMLVYHTPPLSTPQYHHKTVKLFVHILQTSLTYMYSTLYGDSQVAGNLHWLQTQRVLPSKLCLQNKCY